MFVNVCNNKHREEGLDVQFHVVINLKGNGDLSSKFNWKVFGDLHHIFDCVVPVF